jgi:DNA-binding transcriptional ArsR family regulator
MAREATDRSGDATPAPAPITPASARRTADLFKLAGDPTRLAILRLLATGERNVTAICRAFEMTPTAVSFQLTKLRVAGLIESRREGQFNFYSLTDRGRVIAEADLRLGGLDR